jgi:hypothetical protein
VNPLTTLYRPVGLTELRLIAESGYRAFPPRLPTQPIFYPVLYQSYAEQIARDWNTSDPGSGYLGAVTAFAVGGGYLSQFPVKTVGAAHHQELWVPAEELGTFNQHIEGLIRVVAVYYGPLYTGEPIPLSEGSAKD